MRRGCSMCRSTWKGRRQLPAVPAAPRAWRCGCCGALRDYAQVRAQGRITAQVADDALSLLEIDELGLDDLDRRVLDALINKFGGGPVGLDTLAASISEEPDTIMDVVEPYLLQLGFLDRTPRGRVATRAAYAHMQVTLSRTARAERPVWIGAPTGAS